MCTGYQSFASDINVCRKYCQQNLPEKHFAFASLWSLEKALVN